MSLQHILVGLLRQPACGYDLKEVFDQVFRYVWPAELAQIYPTLKKLQRRGWLRSWTEPPRSGPRRRMYQATRAGRAALRQWLAAGPAFSDERYVFSTQIFFLDELGDLKATQAFTRRLRKELQSRLSVLAGYERDAFGSGRKLKTWPDDDFHQYLCLRMGIRVLEARVAWCAEAERMIRLREGKGKSDGNTLQKPGVDSRGRRIRRAGAAVGAAADR